jgi:alanine dehydrogenase
LAQKGIDRALRENPYLAQGLNMRRAAITHRAVAAAFGFAYEAA